VPIKTSFTKLTINFFDLIYYLRYFITKPLSLKHLVVYCLTNLIKQISAVTMDSLSIVHLTSESDIYIDTSDSIVEVTLQLMVSHYVKVQ
jgi:hypothetical protein